MSGFNGLTDKSVDDFNDMRRKVLGRSPSQSVTPTTDEDGSSRPPYMMVKITGGGPLIWDAQRCTFDAAGAVVADPYGLTIKLLVFGPIAKTGLVFMAFALESSCVIDDKYAYFAQGFDWRRLDWGTAGNVSPFIVESDTLKIKTKKTADSVTWTDEKITWDSTLC